MKDYDELVRTLRRNRTDEPAPEEAFLDLASARDRSAQRRRLAARAIGLALTVVLVAGVVAVLRDRGEGGPPASDGNWVPVATVEQLQAEKVIYVQEHRVFVIADAPGLLAVSADVHPASSGLDDLTRRVLYCPSDGWFHGTFGPFDHAGRYFHGPAPRGLDRVAVRVSEGHVEIDPTAVTPGPPRHPRPEEQPRFGAECRFDYQGDPEGKPGFIKESLWGHGPAPSPIETDHAPDICRPMTALGEILTELPDDPQLRSDAAARLRALAADLRVEATQFTTALNDDDRRLLRQLADAVDALAEAVAGGDDARIGEIYERQVSWPAYALARMHCDGAAPPSAP